MTGPEPESGLSTATALGIGLVLVLALAALHLAAPRLRSLPGVPEPALSSFAGGLAVSYVFLHLLPELAEGNIEVGEALGDVVEPTPLTEVAVFMVALTGFLAFYGLQRLAERHAQSERSRAVYRLHLSSFLLYNGLITYTIPLRVRTGLVFAVLFAIAMGLHFVLTDRGLEEHYGTQFGRRSRWLLASALLAGWVLAALASPTRTVVVTVLTALLAGSVLWNVFKDEVPSGGRSRFRWFLAGAVLYAALLLGITALGVS